MSDDIYDIVILGAGPIGLEAALRAADEGYRTVVIERGEIAQNVRDWGHVKLFSPFGMNSSERGRHAIARSFDQDAYLSGDEYVEQYLQPLSDFVSHSVEFRTNTQVLSVERLGWPKGAGLGDPLRAAAPFATHLCHPGDPLSIHGSVCSRCVLDTTGTTNTGDEADANDTRHLRILRRDDAELDALRNVGGTVAVIGTGATAATNVVTLSEMGVPFHWITRNRADDPIAEVPNDPLPGRRELFARANAASRSSLCTRVLGRTYIRHRHDADRVVVETCTSDCVTHEDTFDDVIVNIGQVPDTYLSRRLHVHLCYATEGPIKLAAKLLGESGGNCLTQSGSDASLLVNPEPNFFILGAKSYGRNSNFLIRAGIEQVDAVFDELLPQSLWPLIGRS